MLYKKLSLVIPAYNEELTLSSIVELVVSTQLGNLEKEIIIIDDGSKDSTFLIMQELANKFKEVRIFKNEQNAGKSQTVKRGILESTGDLIVIQDADHEYNPSDLEEFIANFENNDIDLIYGNRFGKSNAVIYWQNWFGNRFLSFISSLFTYPIGGIWTNDMEVCYKMAKGNVFREVAQKITSKSNFGFEPEVTAKFAKYRLNGKRLHFKELPISYKPRSFEEGKKMSAIKDGIKAFKEIVKFNLLG
ncbi:glycosyltransferase family 2 protein [Candidatus Dojkabacteria bacterium]|uniref:Glycosyltransferase family 2 protein n=1 Tax=Candidatus Dojkabacteria bacterium TaxID=2099670 RepID=A0A955IEW2_9BACT|nr:glycosyltransferase family 2 protein [Candidatus Dojkabacteria bacterium]